MSGPDELLTEAVFSECGLEVEDGVADVRVAAVVPVHLKKTVSFRYSFLGYPTIAGHVSDLPGTPSFLHQPW